MLPSQHLGRNTPVSWTLCSLPSPGRPHSTLAPLLYPQCVILKKLLPQLFSLPPPSEMGSLAGVPGRCLIKHSAAKAEPCPSHPTEHLHQGSSYTHSPPRASWKGPYCPHGTQTLPRDALLLICWHQLPLHTPRGTIPGCILQIMLPELRNAAALVGGK